MGSLELRNSVLRTQLLEVRNCSLQAFREHHRRLPVQQLLRLANVRTTLSWIVLRQEHDGRSVSGSRSSRSPSLPSHES